MEGIKDNLYDIISIIYKAKEKLEFSNVTKKELEFALYNLVSCQNDDFGSLNIIKRKIEYVIEEQDQISIDDYMMIARKLMSENELFKNSEIIDEEYLFDNYSIEDSQLKNIQNFDFEHFDLTNSDIMKLDIEKLSYKIQLNIDIILFALSKTTYFNPRQVNGAKKKLMKYFNDPNRVIKVSNEENPDSDFALEEDECQHEENHNYPDLLQSDNVNNNQNKNNQKIANFSELSVESQNITLEVLEDLCLTLNHKSILTKKKKGALRGVVEGLKEESKLPPIDLHHLISIIACKIELEVKSKLKETNVSELYLKKTVAFVESK